MSETTSTRRDALRSIAVSLAAAGAIGEADAQHVHHEVAEVKKAAAGVYKPKVFTPHEWKTLAMLADLIIPADEVSPSATAAGAPEFIDLLANNNERLRTIFTGGLGWLDRECEKRHQALFVNAKPTQQKALLDLIAYRKNAEADPSLLPGIAFFDWARRMTVDAFYTSPLGVKDIGYVGNKGMTTFQVPADALAYALKRSGLG
ncbi:MAG: gluconate 2-dehydrogenase subunit 3 family protein [Bryobacteraceae bacterium]|nr:gluconate 2-dehydrogenase subunit 3 family protein [Bryobacteraceae bacterium]